VWVIDLIVTLRNNEPFVHNSMYRGAMEPFSLKGVYPLGWGAGWAVTRKCWGWVQSKSEEPEDRHWTLTIVGAD
jgi:hypothetical protein